MKRSIETQNLCDDHAWAGLGECPECEKAHSGWYEVFPEGGTPIEIVSLSDKVRKLEQECVRLKTIADNYYALSVDANVELEALKKQQAGEVVVTRTQSGAIVAVTRQDAEGRVLSVIAEAPQPAPAQDK